jgi:hypothetical protein
MPSALAQALRILTDPFSLWTLALLAVGGAEVYRLPARSAVLQVRILVAVLSLQFSLLATVGIDWRI